MLGLFEKLQDAIGTIQEEAVLDAIYELMPARNFSSDLLTPAANQIAVIPMEGIAWSDWGRAERISEILCHIGKQPNFPMILAGHRLWPAKGSGQDNCRLAAS